MLLTLIALAFAPGGFQLSTGTKVDYIVVSDLATKKSWYTDGKPVDHWVYPEMFKRMKANPNAPARLIMATITPKKPTNIPSAAFRFGNGPVEPSGFMLLEPGNSSWSTGVEKLLGTGKTHVEMKIGITDGAWTAKGWFEPRTHRSGGVNFHMTAVQEKLDPRVKGQNETVAVSLTLPETYIANAFRVVALDKEGKLLRDAGEYYGPKHLPTNCMFAGNLREIARIEVQTRAYEWFSLKDVHLEPNP